MTTQQRREALDRLSARLPTIVCQGKCQRYCGHVPMSRLERDRIVERVGEPRTFHGFNCNLLDKSTGRCTVYEIRPLICRIWGCVKKLACPHGCKPSRWMSDKEAKAFVVKIHELEAR